MTEKQMQNYIEGFRLAPPQQQLWSSRPEAADGRAVCAVRLEGELSAARLRAALDAVVARHDILRTTYQRPPGLRTPLQVVAGEAAVSWHESDLAGADAGARAALVAQAFADEWRAPAGDVAARASLLGLGGHRHVLFISLPALSADERTFVNLVEELARLYGGRAVGEDDEPVQYGQFSAWLNGLTESEEGVRGAEFWQSRRSSAPEPLTPPLAGRAAPVSEFGCQETLIEGELLARLEFTAETHAGSLPLLLLAGWQVLLHRLTGAGEFDLYTQFDGRRFEELSDALGMFARRLPLRCHIDPELSLAGLCRRVAEAESETAEWQEFYETAGDEAEPDGARVAFEFQGRAPALRASGVAFVLERRHTWDEPCALKLRCVSREGALGVELHYDRGLYEESVVRRLADYLRTLLVEVCGAPNRAVGDFELLSGAERSQLLDVWNRTSAPYPRERCVHELFEAQAARTPDAVAVSCATETLTYAELDARSNRLAQYLRGLGVGPDSRVGILLERSSRALVALLGVLKAGGAYVPLAAEYPPERLSFMVADAGVGVVLTQRELVGRAPAEAAQVLCLDAEAEWPQVAAQRDDAPATRPDNLAYIIYTSGSTGRPKGVMISHAGLVNYLSWCTEAYDVAGGEGAPVHSPLGFDLTVTGLFAPLLVGRHVSMLPESEGITALARALRAGRDLSLVKLTPAHLQLLSQLLPASEAAGHARAFIVGGEMLTAETLRFWREHAPETKIVNEYGPTETVVGCCVYEMPADGTASGPVPIGRPIANTRMYVLDARLRPVPPGVTGELYIGGAGLARGYVNRPALTAERFVPDPFASEPGARLYRTGDLGRHLPDGNLEFLGRRDSQMKIRGYRIELGEIEAVLRRHADVRDALVLTRADKGGDRQLVAYVIGAPGAPPAAGALLRYLKEKLPEYMVPRAFALLEAFPLTHNGKIDQRRLPEPEAVRSEQGASYVPPRTEVEAVIAQFWQEALGVERIGVHDNFFDLGGHSFTVVEVGARLAERYGGEVTLLDLFRYPTASLLARHLSGESQPPAPEPGAAQDDARKNTFRRQRQQRAQNRAASR